ncbi:hypothetical protein [Clostridium ljungdahlii]|uniref:Uncharacterized protein n=1 Tax=Clostridium ljungdahlii TaxID=1538 RepID=A0A168LMC4_9CLOT|nr:hypothetical protein [Clostridium ljungdahlii]OAA83427.1 hypothetical protein WY13_03212 [Clostridium ljungdahlii]
MPDNHIGSYRAEYNGKVKKANSYTLSIVDNDKKFTKATFKLKNSNFNLELDIPKSGKSILNKIVNYKGFKFKIISINRLSNDSIELIYNYINDSNSRLQTSNILFESVTGGE